MLKYTNPYNILDYKFTVLVFFFLTDTVLVIIIY